jgi:hypothetical protein
MPDPELATTALRGTYRDVVCDAAGRATWDSGWRSNSIVLDCRRLLAALMRGDASTFGIQGLQVGAGNPAWDGALPPPTTTADIKLVDPNPYTVPASALVLSYLDPTTGAVTVAPTNRLQIVATLGPSVPTWPDGTHTTGTLREFGLVGTLGTVGTVLINEVRHVAIPKDPVSTLVRTIQLVF